MIPLRSPPGWGGNLHLLYRSIGSWELWLIAAEAEMVERIDAVPLWLQPQLPLAEMVEIVQVQPQLAETCEMFQRAKVETVPLRLQLVLLVDWTEELSQACRSVSIDRRIDRADDSGIQLQLEWVVARPPALLPSPLLPAEVLQTTSWESDRRPGEVLPAKTIPL